MDPWYKIAVLRKVVRGCQTFSPVDIALASEMDGNGWNGRLLALLLLYLVLPDQMGSELGNEEVGR